jgi:hypothetical protein
MYTKTILPTKIERDHIVEAGVPALVFDKLEELIATIPNLVSVSYWTYGAREFAREINTALHKYYLGLDTDHGLIRVVDYAKKNGFKKPSYQGPLNLPGVSGALESIR